MSMWKNIDQRLYCKGRHVRSDGTIYRPPCNCYRCEEKKCSQRRQEEKEVEEPEGKDRTWPVGPISKAYSRLEGLY